jgi:hypothetical protein
MVISLLHRFLSRFAYVYDMDAVYFGRLDGHHDIPFHVVSSFLRTNSVFFQYMPFNFIVI